MKYLIAIVFLISSGLSTYAQQAHKFRVGADFGYVKPITGNGLLFSVEPKYTLTDKLHLGFRWEVAFMAKESVAGSDASSEGIYSANTAYLATLDYFYNRGGSFAPYGGLGLGMYNLGNVTAKGSGSGGASGGAKFGGMLRIGFEKNNLRAGVMYNIMSATDFAAVPPGEASSVKNSYIGIHVGIFIGGGKWGYVKPEDEVK